MKKNDFYLIGGIIVFILVAFIGLYIFRTEGTMVVVSVNEKELISLPLDEDTTYTIHHDDGQWNTIEIKDGYVSMLDASCPQKICVKHHKIHYSFESIYCNPNEVFLRIVDDTENELDAIAK
ncbi:MAG: NusG domain II-containing protein [Clostridiales bacterium]|nr:NusG domain II-containing protein [Clostridiales bacterium]